MREERTITLKKPIEGHHGKITQVVLREPTFDQYLEFGEPYTIAASKDGTPFGVENNDVIRQYLAVCVKEPVDKLILTQLSVSDARKLKDALLGFFRPDEQDETVNSGGD